ncbi:MAG: hypothetical protein JSR60_06880 [Proteobacteria bacterium]|nr:hypothetical protein [Pseudomonadota bacterium]
MAAPALADEPFDGKWSGVIHFDKEAFLLESSTPAGGLTMGLDIHGPVVRVTVREKDGDEEVKPGLFHIAAVQSNAVIFATEAAPGDSWVESWAFVVTCTDDKTMRVEYVRLVKNPGPGDDGAPETFATRGEGTFERTGL